jgi:ATP-binding cassette subfamily B protein
MRKLLRDIPGVTIAVSEMVKLAWQAQPAIFAGLILLTVFQAGLPVALTWATKLLFDQLGLLLAGNANGDLARGLWPILVLQGVLLVLSKLADPIAHYLDAEVGRRVTAVVQSNVYRKIGSFVGILYFEDPEFHDTLRLASQGAQSGPMQTLQTLIRLLQGITKLFAFLGILVVVSPFLAVLVGLITLPRLFGELRIGRMRFKMATELSREERQVFYYSSLLSGIEAAKEIRLFGLADHFLDGLLNTYRKIHRVQSRQQLRELRWIFLQEVWTALGYSVVFSIFALIVVQTATGRMSLGDIPLYFGALGGLRSALEDIVHALASLSEYALFFSHYRNLLALPQPVQVAGQTRPVPPLVSGIEIHNVSFRYTPQHPWILRNVNLYIPATKCLALVGMNGVGKTTLVKLLTRLYDPTEGQILWDGIDTREFDPEELRHNMGVILQDYTRYALTAHENIGLGDIAKLDNEARVHQAAMKAGVHEMIKALPQAYQTILSRWLVDDGTGIDLSGGQWQCIALARLFMRDASVLVMDEPTAVLDAQAEYDFYSRFVDLADGRTSLLISHRFSTVKMADIVAVLENGKITEYGSHAELLSQGRTYAHLYTMQAERYN